MALPVEVKLHVYAVNELVGRPIEMLFPAVEKPIAEEVKKRTDQLGEALLTETHVRKDGSTFDVLRQVTSISSAGERVHFRIYTVMDLDMAQTWQSFVADAKKRIS